MYSIAEDYRLRMKQPYPRSLAIRDFVRLHETKIRFVVAGGINTALGLALFPALYLLLAPLQIHYVFLLIVSNFICVAFAFLTNKFFVFRTSGNYFREFARFVLFHLSHFALNLVAVPLLVEFAGVSPIIAQPFFAAAIVISSYFWHRHFTFIGKRHDEAKRIYPVPTET
jgi:putative flippase GtrA